MNKIIMFMFVLLVSLVGVNANTFNVSLDEYQFYGDTNEDPDSFTNYNNGFDDNEATQTYKYLTPLTGTYSHYIGKKFNTEKYIGYVKINASVLINTGGFSHTQTFYIESFDGSTWSNEGTLTTATGINPNLDYNDYYYLNKSVEGVRLRSFHDGGGGVDIYTYLDEMSFHEQLDIYSSDENNQYNINFPMNSNISYSINGSSYTSLCNNCVDYNLSLNSSEGVNDLIIRGVGTSTTLYFDGNLTIDTTNPSLTESLPSSYDDYNEFNFSNYITYSDINILSCSVIITNESTTTCDDESYNFSTNGNKNINVIVTDLAGNINSSLSNVMLINPYQYVYFQNGTGSDITNFTVNSTNYINYFQFQVYDYGLGTHSFLFEKLGFNNTPFSLTLNSTSNINTTLTIPGVLIQISIFDITDYTLIDNSTTTVEIIGDSFSDVFTTSDGYLNISSTEMIEDTYTIIVSNSLFETTTTAFNYNNQEILTVNAYLTPLTTNTTLIADIIISVVDDYGSPLRYYDVTQYVWDSGASEYVQSNLKATDYNGQTSFKVFLNTKLYNFCVEYDSILYCETDLSININTQEIVIEVPVSTLTTFNESSISWVEFPFSLINTTVEILSINYTSVTFTYNNANQDVDEYCLSIYEIDNLKRTLVSSQCSVSHSAGLSINVVENTSKNYVAIATIQQDNTLRELDDLYLYATFSFQEELEQYGFIKILILGVIGFIIALAVNKKTHNIIIAHLGLPIAFLILSILFPNYLSFESVILVSIINWFAWKLITKKDDINKDAKFSTLTTILSLYMIFIFSLTVVLSEMDDKGLLDDYGTTLLYGDDTKDPSIDGLVDKESYFSQFTETTNENLKNKQAGASTGAWDLLTGIFLKTLEFVDMFFSILSNLFGIATNMLLIISIENGLLLQFASVIDFLIIAYILKLYFDEAFK